MTFQERNDQGPEDAPSPEFVEKLARELFAAGELHVTDRPHTADVFEHLTLEDRERFLELAVERIRAGEHLRMVCPAPGWGGAGHAEPITVRAGLEPISHGMCPPCHDAFGLDDDDVPVPTTEFTWHVCGGCGQRWGDKAKDYERCPACLSAGAAALARVAELEAALREAAGVLEMIENIWGRGKIVARDSIRAVLEPNPTDTSGASALLAAIHERDRATGPDRLVARCGTCLFVCSTVQELVDHDCPGPPPRPVEDEPDACPECGREYEEVIAQDMADEYARNARTYTGQPYGHRYRKQLVRWWMAGWRNERHGFPQIGTNFEAPLHSAWTAGQRAREESPL